MSAGEPRRGAPSAWFGWCLPSASSEAYGLRSVLELRIIRYGKRTSRARHGCPDSPAAPRRKSPPLRDARWSSYPTRRPSPPPTGRYGDSQCDLVPSGFSLARRDHATPTKRCTRRPSLKGDSYDGGPACLWLTSLPPFIPITQEW